MRNIVQTTQFMHIPIAEFDAAVEFFREVLGFNEHRHVRDYAYLERDGCGIRIWGREDAADAPRGVRNFRYYFDVRDVDALYAELKPKLDKLPKGDVAWPRGQAVPRARAAGACTGRRPGVLRAAIVSDVVSSLSWGWT